MMRNGKCHLAAVAGLATLISGAWFLPPPPAETIESIHVPSSNVLRNEPDGITAVHSDDELRQALPATDLRELPYVNWDTTELVRVHCRASGYMLPGDTTPRYGVVTERNRLGGAMVFLYVDEPTSLWFPAEVSMVFSQIVRDDWLAVPKGTRLQWNTKSNVELADLGFAVPAILSIFAFAWTLLRRRRARPTAQFQELEVCTTASAM